MQQEKLAATRELWAGQGSVAQLHCMQAAHTPIAYPIEPGIIGARNPKKKAHSILSTNQINKPTEIRRQAAQFCVPSRTPRKKES